MNAWQTWSAWGLPDAHGPRLTSLHTHPADVIATVGDVADDLADLIGQDATDAPLDRLLRAPAWGDSIDRWAAMASLELLTGCRPTPLPGWLRRTERVRLRPSELAMLRLSVLHDPQRAVAVAGYEAGITSAGLGVANGLEVRAGKASIDTNGVAVALPRWAAPAALKLVSHSRRSDAVLYGGAATDMGRAGNAVDVRLRRAMDDAGLDNALSPSAIRVAAAKAIADEMGVFAAAKLLDMRSLAVVQRLLASD